MHLRIWIAFNIIKCYLIALYTTLSEKQIQNLTLWYSLFEVRIMKPLKKKVNITLDEDVIDGLKTLADESDRSFSQYINLILKEYLNKSILMR